MYKRMEKNNHSVKQYKFDVIIIDIKKKKKKKKKNKKKNN